MVKRIRKKMLEKKIQYLNDAYNHIETGLMIVKKHFKKESEIMAHIKQIETGLQQLYALIIHELEKRAIEQDFEEVIKGYDKIYKRRKGKRHDK